jgi:hypothetical protein
MKYIVLVLNLLLAGCISGSLKPQNDSGLQVTVEAVKRHHDDVDVRMILHNTTGQAMRLPPHGSISLIVNGDERFKGDLRQTVDIGPGGQRKVAVRFEILNAGGMVKHGLIEIVPQKVFKSCKAADADAAVVAEDRRTASTDATAATDMVQADTCDRALRNPIRVAF